MSTNLGVLALLVGFAALGVAIYGVSARVPASGDLEARLAMMEAQIEELERGASRRDRDEPRLRGIDGAGRDGAPVRGRAPTTELLPTDDAPGAARAKSQPGEVAPEAIQALVEEAVEKKAQEVVDAMRLKENKKPSLDLFAEALELTPAQVAALQDNVRRGQFEVHALLDIPTADGSNLMDELVDVVAKGMATPGTDVGWGRLIGRIMSEKIPGSDDTYAVRIESVKARLRETFKRDWRPEQYAEYEAWGVDPTEIQGIPGSPNEALMERIRERARALGATLPSDD